MQINFGANTHPQKMRAKRIRIKINRFEQLGWGDKGQTLRDLLEVPHRHFVVDRHNSTLGRQAFVTSKGSLWRIIFDPKKGLVFDRKITHKKKGKFVPYIERVEMPVTASLEGMFRRVALHLLG